MQMTMMMMFFSMTKVVQGDDAVPDPNSFLNITYSPPPPFHTPPPPTLNNTYNSPPPFPTSDALEKALEFFFCAICALIFIYIYIYRKCTSSRRRRRSGDG
jgi:hypothetical protein